MLWTKLGMGLLGMAGKGLAGSGLLQTISQGLGSGKGGGAGKGAGVCDDPLRQEKAGA